MNQENNNFNNENRLIEIEMKLAYQEDLLQSLNDIVVQQRTTIEFLEMSLMKLVEKINNGSEDAQFSDNVEDDLPPHY